jgi:hypothetical protein
MCATQHKITNCGAKIEQIMVPDKIGKFADVMQGYESIDKAIDGQGSMGAFVGRYANRIGAAKFTLDGKEYLFAKNNGEDSLPGGQKGSRFCVYDAHQIDDASVEMFYTYKDGEENYPGALATRVYYEVTGDNVLVVDIKRSRWTRTPSGTSPPTGSTISQAISAVRFSATSSMATRTGSCPSIADSFRRDNSHRCRILRWISRRRPRSAPASRRLHVHFQYILPSRTVRTIWVPSTGAP